MVRKVSAMTVRDRLGQILEEVYYRGDAVIIERAGRPMAVLGRGTRRLHRLGRPGPVDPGELSHGRRP